MAKISLVSPVDSNSANRKERQTFDNLPRIGTKTKPRQLCFGPFLCFSGSSLFIIYIYKLFRIKELNCEVLMTKIISILFYI